MTDDMKLERKVEVVPHDDLWAAKFDLEEDRLRNLLGDLIVNVHHIGSTAIPGIVAKPIVDILVEVKNLDNVNQFNPGMKQLGYIAKGEFGIAGRRFFIKGTELDRTHHVHIYEVGDVEVARHINFRDYLMLHPNVAVEYSHLKEKLAEKYPNDIDAYMHEKNKFIENIEMQIIIWKKNIEKDLF